MDQATSRGVSQPLPFCGVWRASSNSCPGLGTFFFWFLFFSLYMKDVHRKGEEKRKKKKGKEEKGRETRSLHAALPGGRNPNPGSLRRCKSRPMLCRNSFPSRRGDGIPKKLPARGPTPQRVKMLSFPQRSPVSPFPRAAVLLIRSN